MTFSEAKDFLVQLSKSWNQDAKTVRNFIEWQQRASIEELERLDNWHRDFLSSLRGELSVDEQMVERNRQWLMQNLQDSLTKQNDLKATYKKRGMFFRFAAVILIIIGISTTFFYINRTKKSTADLVTRNRTPHIMPGGDKAILTLADGSQIVLDSTAKGNILLKNGVKVLNIGKGLVACKSVGTAAVSYSTIATPKGGQYQIVLPDGTHVWLNSASSLKFPTAFEGNTRKVTLTGEGYFEVVHNASKPFVVTAENINVKVLGTGFNIMAYVDEQAIKTTLVHGSVEVNSGNVTRHIVPGEQASLIKGGQDFEIAHPNMQEVLAWKRGEFWFNKTSIQSIMRQISRWYNVEIAYKGDLSGIKLSGVLSKKQDVTALFAILEATKQVQFKIEQNKVIVMPYNKI